MKRIITLALLLCALTVTPAHAVKHVSYNPTQWKKPVVGQEISRTMPVYKINIKVQFGNVCLQLMDVNSGNVIWETCF